MKGKAWTKEEHDILKQCVMEASPSESLKDIFNKETVKSLLDRTPTAMAAYYSKVVSNYPNYEDIPTLSRRKKRHGERLRKRMEEMSKSDEAPLKEEGETSKKIGHYDVKKNFAPLDTHKIPDSLLQEIPIPKKPEKKEDKKISTLISVLTPEQKDEFIRKMLME